MVRSAAGCQVTFRTAAWHAQPERARNGEWDLVRARRGQVDRATTGAKRGTLNLSVLETENRIWSVPDAVRLTALRPARSVARSTWACSKRRMGFGPCPTRPGW